jgi:hypothetical protein
VVFPFAFSSTDNGGDEITTTSPPKRTGLQYYEWLDSYLDKLEEEFSSSYFFKKIGWDSVSTLMDYLNRGGEHFNSGGSRTDAK